MTFTLHTKRSKIWICMATIHPGAECWILHIHDFRKQQPSHHSAEALYEDFQQKFGCMTFLDPKEGYCIAHCHSSRRRQQCHRFAGEQYDMSLQTPGCMTFLAEGVE